MDLRSVSDPASWLAGLYAQSGTAQYGGERVSQLEHALQCAFLAEVEGQPLALVCAALLHDVGHLLHQFGPAPAERGIDDRHEAIGAGVLATWFPAAVSEPVRLHVNAKRYLCTVDSGYFGRLSAASVRSLGLQGGIFDAAEAAAFLARPHAPAAVCLRKWDEAAKVPGLETPDLAHFLPLLRSLA